MRHEAWRLGLDEFIQTVGTKYPITHQIYKDKVDGLYAVSIFGVVESGWVHSELILIPQESQERIGLFQIVRGASYTRYQVPLGLVDLLASKSEEYRAYMCRTLGVQ